MIELKKVFRWSQITHDGEVVKRLWEVPEALPYFEGHFPIQSVLPGIAIVDGSLIALMEEGKKKAQLLSAKYKHVILPGQQVQVHVQPSRTDDQVKVTWWIENASGPDTLAAELVMEIIGPNSKG